MCVFFVWGSKTTACLTPGARKTFSYFASKI